MSSEKKKTLKGIIKETKAVKDKKDVDVKIRTKGGNEQTITCKKSGDDYKSEGKVEFEYTIKKDGKWDDNDWKEYKTDVKWTGNFMMNGMEFTDKKLGDSGAELKETIKPGLGFGTLTAISWIGLVVVFISIVALIWWWISSSRSEDKEEEGL